MRVDQGAESTAVIRQYRLRQPRCRHAGTDLVGPAAADSSGGGGWQLDPCGRAPLCREPLAAIQLMQRVRVSRARQVKRQDARQVKQTPLPARFTVAELVLGHAVTGLIKVSDVHDYRRRSATPWRVGRRNLAAVLAGGSVVRSLENQHAYVTLCRSHPPPSELSLHLELDAVQLRLHLGAPLLALLAR
jgi:hypothetical protein